MSMKSTANNVMHALDPNGYVMIMARNAKVKIDRGPAGQIMGSSKTPLELTAKPEGVSIRQVASATATSSIAVEAQGNSVAIGLMSGTYHDPRGRFSVDGGTSTSKQSQAADSIEFPVAEDGEIVILVPPGTKVEILQAPEVTFTPEAIDAGIARRND